MKSCIVEGNSMEFPLFYYIGKYKFKEIGK
ncbi:hypothetical protein FUSO3_11925 [Fusobacterium necrophorum BL]|uniref:Uncharacterized protein n=1 Tax=Fusobacterium necrophorum BL TaxID=1441732 RepID=A0AB73BT62_9FUSO|nr:hypothetical protein FUSO3_11925 [Fusobacterium necrophorum BL]